MTQICVRGRAALLSLLTVAALVAGCGGDDSGSAAPARPGLSPSDSQAAPSGSAGPSAACPSDNTRSFAKTRFVADLGGAAFLTKRYVYDPYRAGKFARGASGRTVAVVKAGVAAATSVKLLKNAQENAKADPTLCRTIATPMAAAIAALGGVTGALTGGDLSALSGLGGALDNLRGLAGSAGVDVPEREVGLNGS